MVNVGQCECQFGCCAEIPNVSRPTVEVKNCKDAGQTDLVQQVYFVYSPL